MDSIFVFNNMIDFSSFENRYLLDATNHNL